MQLRVLMALTMQHFSLDSVLTDRLDIVAVFITNLCI